MDFSKLKKVLNTLQTISSDIESPDIMILRDEVQLERDEHGDIFFPICDDGITILVKVNLKETGLK